MDLGHEALILLGLLDRRLVLFLQLLELGPGLVLPHGALELDRRVVLLLGLAELSVGGHAGNISPTATAHAGPTIVATRQYEPLEVVFSKFGCPAVFEMPKVHGVSDLLFLSRCLIQ